MVSLEFNSVKTIYINNMVAAWLKLIFIIIIAVLMF
jgi:hypothetical protein